MTATIKDFVDRTYKNQHFYFDGTSGLDANDGLALATPKKTLQAIFDIIPEAIYHYIYIHATGVCDSAAISPEFTKRITPDAMVLIDGGDTHTVVAGPFTATGAAINSITVAAAGWGVDGYAGYIIEILDGVADDNYRTVSKNTVDTIYPSIDFSAIPAGAQFRIVRPTTEFKANAYTVLYLASYDIGPIQFSRIYFSQGLTIYPQILTNLLMSGCVLNNGNASVGCIGNNGSTAVTLWAKNFWWTGYPTQYKVGVGIVTTNPILMQRGIFGCYNSYFKNVTLKNVQQTVSRISATRINGLLDMRDFLFMGDDSGYVFIEQGTGFPTTIENASGVGLRAYNCEFTIKGGVSVSNCAGHGIEAIRSFIKFTGVVAGSGNTGAGVYAHLGSIITPKIGSPPTITGTVGNLAVEDPAVQQESWANVNAGTVVSIAGEGTVVKAVA